ncbi:MAG: XdhC/CoxI family protein [candidate division WOR-3 bacterium]
MDAELQKRVLAALEANTPAVLVTVVGTKGSTPAVVGARMLVYPDRTIYGTVGGGVLEYKAIETALAANGPPHTAQFALITDGSERSDSGLSADCGGSVELLFEPLARADLLFVVGAGHCALELVPLCRKLGFHVTVLDDRPDWASRKRHPQADKVICTDYAQAGKHIRFTRRTYVVIMTHGHKHDETVLRQCLRREFAYLGMIGSEKKVLSCFERLRSEGFTREELSKVYSPIGFAVGSRTPPEIAVSVAAQLLAVRNGCASLRFNSNPLLST